MSQTAEIHSRVRVHFVSFTKKYALIIIFRAFIKISISNVFHFRRKFYEAQCKMPKRKATQQDRDFAEPGYLRIKVVGQVSCILSGNILFNFLAYDK
jgi:hypothetical protein